MLGISGKQREATMTKPKRFPMGCPAPSGYVHWHEWAEAQGKAGLKQRQCPRCKLWRFPQESCFRLKKCEQTKMDGIDPGIACIVCKEKPRRTRGLCNRCMTRMYVRIKKGETTLEAEEAAGRLLPKKNPRGILYKRIAGQK